jgi:branched-chain amino acid transport system substrate-binding protein
MGMLTALREINDAGGVLGGRKLRLIESDNRSVPARGRDNFRQHAADPMVVAVFTGKFSPVALEQAKIADELKLPLLDPWAAADSIIKDDPAGSFAFRLSLRDSWAVPAMMAYLQARGIRQVGVLLPTSGWGRSNEVQSKKFMNKAQGASVVAVEWYNWGATTMLTAYRKLRAAGAQALLLVANEPEGSILVSELARLPASERIPIVSHWGVAGGNFVEMVGQDLDKVNFAVVQTFTFVGRHDKKALDVLASAGKTLGIKTYLGIPSHVGFAHAYDLTHILARAIELAGSTDRDRVRSALEKVRDYDGLVGRLSAPFTPARHEALSPSHVFIGRFQRSGVIERLLF